METTTPRRAILSTLANVAFFLLFYAPFGSAAPTDDVNALREAAEVGDAPAMLHLGYSYYMGDGVPKDRAEGVKWSRKAAEAGNASAMLTLGDCYYKGDVVPLNREEAVKWYRKGAEAGNNGAMLALGRCYKEGHGVPKDRGKAMMWFRAGGQVGPAGTEGNPGAGYSQDNSVPKSTGTGLAEPQANGSQASRRYYSDDHTVSFLLPLGWRINHDLGAIDRLYLFHAGKVKLDEADRSQGLYVTRHTKFANLNKFLNSVPPQSSSSKHYVAFCGNFAIRFDWGAWVEYYFSRGEYSYHVCADAFLHKGDDDALWRSRGDAILHTMEFHD